MLKPLYQGVSSLARRRSYKPSGTLSRIAAHQGGGGGTGGGARATTREKRLGMLESNCMHSFRKSMLISGALPFLHWSPTDISSRALHFEHQPPALHETKRRRHHRRNHRKAGPGGDAKVASGRKLAAATAQQQQHHQGTAVVSGRRGTKSITGLAKHLTSSWLPGGGGGKERGGHRPQHSVKGPHRGRPNVVVTHFANKIEVRSLKNGRSLCHLSLWQDALYADLNHDGILDSVTVVTGERGLEDDDAPDPGRRWVAQLVRRIQGIKDSAEKKQVGEELKGQKIVDHASLCHVQVLSGVPSKEELYSVDVCGSKRDQGSSKLSEDLAATGPALVEPLRGRGNDIVVALNNGVVTRLEGATGLKQWQWSGARHLEDFPTWEDESVAVVARIDSPNVIHSMRPILVMGENSMVLLSARQGKYLASATFPQVVSARPLIADLNGDGTADVLVWTADAFWGYQVRVRTGGSLAFRTVVGLVLMGLMLALLRNRFGPQPGKRSTDA